MREIKFRTWLPTEQRMGTPFELRFGLNEPGVFSDEIIFMQYTGLHDKNGKEIYEGDIVEITNPKYQVQKKRISGVVTFSWGAFGIEINKINTWDGYHVEPPEYMWFLNIAGLNMSEVIGNIYENMGLLEGTK